MKINRLPNTFIIGAAKCATSTVAGWLAQNPHCYLQYNKENYFFSRDYHLGIDWYLKNFYRGVGPQKAVIDATATHQVLHFAPKRIAQVAGADAKIILCVRPPMERAFSHWSMYKSWRPGRVWDHFYNQLEESMEKFDKNRFMLEGDYVMTMEPRGSSYANTFLEESMYFHNMSFYTHIFHNILVVELSEIAKRPIQTYRSICDFLEVPPVEVSLHTTDNNTKSDNVYKYWCDNISPSHELWIKNVIEPDTAAFNRQFNTLLTVY